MTSLKINDNRLQIIFKGEEVLNTEIDDVFKELTFTSNIDKFRVKIERID